MKSSSTKLKFPPILFVVTAGLILSIPILLYGFPFFSDDGKYHALWHVSFSQQLRQGELYPRWLSAMNNGLGSPTFFYYPPVPYYFSAFWQFLISNDTNGWYQLGFSAATALIASGVTAFFWLKKIAGQTAAVIAAILYMAMPYHLAIDLWVRGSFAEFGAFVWLPLILLCVKKTGEGSKSAIFALAVCYALLIMTHLPTALIFSPVPLVYAVISGAPGQKLKHLFLILSAMLNGISLAAIYLIPALTMREFVSMPEMQRDDFYFANNFFVISTFWAMTGTTRILFVTCLTFGIALCFFLIGYFLRKGRVGKELIFWFVTAVSSCLMMTSLSQPIWQIASPLQNIQFPWRFNVLLVVATSAVVAIGFSNLKKPFPLSVKLMLSIALPITLSFVPITAYQIWRVFPALRDLPEKHAKLNKQLQLRRDAREYRTIWATDAADKKMEGFLEQFSLDEAQAEIVEGTGEVSVIEWKPREIILRLNSSTAVKIEVKRFYFAGLTAQTTDENEFFNLEPRIGSGLITLQVPAGQRTMAIRLERTRSEFVGQIVSAVSLLLSACVFLVWFAKSRILSF